MKYLSVCSGMEAASVAWEPLGFTPVGFSEIEPFPCAILKHRFPNTPNYGDLTKYNEWPIEPGTIDIIAGGTPCQAFSVAGLRRGLEDPRGNLALTFLGLVDKLRPKWVVWENVPGVLSSSGGNDFASFLSALGQLRYGWAYRVLDAQYFGIPQRRRRVFCIATSTGDGRLAAEVLSLPEGLRGYFEARGKKGKRTSTDAGASTTPDGGSGDILWSGSDQPNAERLINKAGTLNCNQGQRGGYIIPNDGSSIVEPKFKNNNETVGTLCARDYKGVGNQYVQEGKCIPCEAPTPYRKSKRASSTTDDESWVEGDVSNTLNNFDLGDTRTTHAVVEPVPIQDGRDIEKKQNGLGVGNPGDPAYTIDTTGSQAAGVIAYSFDSLASNSMKSSNPNSGCREVDLAKTIDTFNPCPSKNQGGIGILQPIAIQGTIIGRSETAGPQGVGAQEGGPMYTLTKTDVHGVLYENHAQDSRVNGPLEIAPTVAAKFGTGGGNIPLVNQEPAPLMFKVRGGVESNDGSQGGEVGKTAGKGFLGSEDKTFTVATVQDQWLAKPAMAVRRLTPVECERLQGFPDNWSRISWKGKPEEDCPDGPRYKACGNSMAVPVMRWIGKQIALVEKRINEQNV